MATLLEKEKPKPVEQSPINVKHWCDFLDFELWEPDNWDGPEVTPQLEEMIRQVAYFCEEIRDNKSPRWLSLLGSSGTGKSYIAKRIYKWAKTKIHTTVGADIEYGCDYCDWSALAGKLKANDGYERLQDLCEAKFVLIDEIGADKDKNGVVMDHLARLLISRANKWTLITSNLSLAQIQSLDVRIASRLIRDGSEVVNLSAPDYSLYKKGML